jgi:hypothetical protein
MVETRLTKFRIVTGKKNNEKRRVVQRPVWPNPQGVDVKNGNAGL